MPPKRKTHKKVIGHTGECHTPIGPNPQPRTEREYSKTKNGSIDIKKVRHIYANPKGPSKPKGQYGQAFDVSSDFMTSDEELQALKKRTYDKVKPVHTWTSKKKKYPPLPKTAFDVSSDEETRKKKRK